MKQISKVLYYSFLGTGLVTVPVGFMWLIIAVLTGANPWIAPLITLGGMAIAILAIPVVILNYLLTN